MFLKERIDLSFWPIFILAIPPNQPKALVASLRMSGYDWARLDTTNQKSWPRILSFFGEYFHAKVKHINTFLIDIFITKKSCNLIWQEHFGQWLVKQNFFRYKICAGKQSIASSFSLGYFQQRSNSSFMKTQENSILGLFWTLFAYFKANKNFSG